MVRSRARLKIAWFLPIAVLAASGFLVSAKPGSTAAAPGPGCPTALPRTVHSPRFGAATALVPTGVAQVVLCRFDGPFAAPAVHVLKRFRRVAGLMISDPRRVDALARMFNQLPKMPGSFACPTASGAAIIAFFRYANGPPSPVRVALTGCMTASNGHLVRAAGLDGTTLLDQLEALVHAQPSGLGGTGGSAVVDGYVRLCGGPAPGRCFASTIGGCAPAQGCAESDRVLAIDTDGIVVAAQKLRPGNSHFRLLLPPGNYAIELLADGKRVHDRLLQIQGATARPRHVATVLFRFDVP